MQKELINACEFSKILDRLTFQVAESCDLLNLCVVGIHRRGVHLAKRFCSLIEKHHGVILPQGTLDITLYRDDLSEIAAFPQVYSTEFGFDVNGKDILLVDDVIYTGRTVRAALECIIDFGRPSRIKMLAIIDRGHRELPIQPDFTGKVIPTSKKEIVCVNVGEIDGIDSVTIGEKQDELSV